MEGKKIVLGVTGGIAAYKAPLIVRLLKAQGAEVRCVMTRNAEEFVTALTLQTVSKNKVYIETFEKHGVWNPEHIALSDWGDIMLVAPATANCIGKYAAGIADDLLTTTLLAFGGKVVIAPAMNDKMYSNPIAQRNIKTLKEFGVEFIEPIIGELACGAVGQGKMEEPEKIVKFIKSRL